MRTIQDIFDIVIKEGYYSDYFDVRSQDLMCISLKTCASYGHITEEESEYCKKQITEYLTGLSDMQYNTLRYALQVNDLPSSFEDRLHIYKNWSDRPQLLK